MTGGAKPGTKEYMSFYQKGLNKLMDKVKESEIEEAKLLAEKWNNEGPPDAVKSKYVLITQSRWILSKLLRNAETKGAKYIKQFCRDMKKLCGMNCVVLETHKSRTGNAVVT